MGLKKMRLIWIVISLFALVAPVWAAPGDEYEITSQAEPGLIDPLMMRSRGSAEALNAPAGFDLTRFASRLGDIADIALSADGAVFVSDHKHGRIFEISDRGRDGQADHQREIVPGLDRPSGLALVGEHLFIADQQALWRWDRDQQSLSVMVNLSNLPAGPRRPLLYRPADNALWIAMNQAGQTSKIIAVDLSSGRAALITEVNGHVFDFVANGPSDVWAASDRRLIRIGSGAQRYDEFQIESGARIGGLVTLSADDPADRFSKWAEHILIAQTGLGRLHSSTSGGLNVIAVPTRFGLPQPQMEVVIDGFLSANRRSAWGAPGALAYDGRGLFMASPAQGTLWVMRGAPEKPASLKPVKAKPKAKPKPIVPEDPTPTPPPIIRGSQIETASKIEMGSKIIRDFEEAQKEKEAKEKSDQSDPD